MAATAGKLKIVLGYAAGVGKTYKMLEEGQGLKAEGHDVVIGYFEPHGRQDTIAKTAGLEFVPRKTVEYRGLALEEMDAEAILERRPEICLVDEFPHTNVPGSARGKRWEDVLALLDAGIDVITTMNIQHLESLNDQVREVSGISVRETVPDWVMKRAAELVVVDLTPGALLNRLDRGVVYAPDKAQRAKENFFKDTTLGALREMALRQAAHEVDARQDTGGERERERVLIHITDSGNTAGLIRRGQRVADYLRAECFAVAVVSGAASEAVEEHLDFARRLHIETRVLLGEDEAEAIVEFARTNAITQIFVAKPERRGLTRFGIKGQVAMRIIRLAREIQVTVVAERQRRE
ncbi:MAG: histidine kinase [Acidobacteria bacterium]|nr:histidine kinase [Acidobacteriota bacterium]